MKKNHFIIFIISIIFITVDFLIVWIVLNDAEETTEADKKELERFMDELNSMMQPPPTIPSPPIVPIPGIGGDDSSKLADPVNEQNELRPPIPNPSNVKGVYPNSITLGGNIGGGGGSGKSVEPSRKEDEKPAKTNDTEETNNPKSDTDKKDSDEDID